MVEILKLMLGRDSEDEICKNLLYDLRSYFGKQNLTLGSVLPLAMFVIYQAPDLKSSFSVILPYFPILAKPMFHFNHNIELERERERQTVNSV